MNDLADLFTGLVFFGTGGGGKADAGLALLEAHFGRDWMPRFTDPAMLPDETIVAATIVIGGRDPVEDMPAAERKRLGLPADDLPIAERFARSIAALSRHLPRPIGALAVVELGSLAMAVTLIAADRLGLPVLDGDCTGRSIPELGLTKMDLVGQSVSPICLVDRFGGETIVSGRVGAAMADRMARQLSRAVLGRGLAATAYPAELRDFSRGLVTGSVQQAWRVGRILRGDGSIEGRLLDLFQQTGGRLICRVKAERTHWRNLEPYAFRELDYNMAGLGEHAGAEIRVFVKNEHHAVWINETLVTSSPDVIAVLDATDLRPLTTLGEVTDGLEVLVVAMPALDDGWRTEAGRKLLGPRRFDIDADAVLIVN